MMKVITVRMVSIFTVLTILISAIIQPVSIKAADITDEVSKEGETISENQVVSDSELQLLAVLGIIEDEDIYRPMNENIYRAELAMLASRLAGLEEVAKAYADVTIFEDVPIDSFEAAYINAISETGHMDGTSYNKFSPALPSTYNQAIKVIVNVLGYSRLAEGFGGYPIGYVVVATEKGLLKGADITDMKEYTRRGNIYKIICNALEADIYKLTSFGSEMKYTIEDGKNALSEYLKIIKAEGVVEATSSTALNGISGAVKEGYVRIGSELLEIGTTDINQYLGYYCIYYYKEIDGQKRIIYYNVSDEKNETLIVEAQDIISYDKMEYVYSEPEDSNHKTVSIKGAHVIYNGHAQTMDYSQLIMIPDLGFITFVDNNRDGKYDVVLIDSRVEYYVEKVDTTEYIIYDQYDRVLKLEPDKNEIFITGTDGSRLDLSYIKRGVVLTVNESYNENLYHIRICTDTVNGRISEIGEENGRAFVVIDGKTYGVSNSYLDAVNRKKIFQYELGADAVFYLSSDNNIVYYESIKRAAGKFEFGILVAADRPSGLSSDIKIRVFTTMSRFENFLVAESVELDNVRIKNVFEIYAALCRDGEDGEISSEGNVVPQLIRFKLDGDSKVLAIDRVGKQEDYEALYMSYDSMNSPLSYKWSTGIFGGKVIGDTNTKVFMVPMTQDGVINPNLEDGFAFTGMGYFLNQTSYTFRAYKVEARKLSHDVLIIRAPINENGELDPRIDTEQPMAIITRITDVINDEGEIVQKINCRINRTDQEYYTIRDGMTKNIRVQRQNSDETYLYSLKSGDIIRYHLDVNQRIDKILPIFDGTNRTFLIKDVVEDSNSNPNIAILDSSRMYKATYGSVEYRVDDIIKLIPGHMEENPELDDYSLHPLNKYPVYYQYDSSKNKLSEIKLEDIIDYESSPDTYSKLFVWTRYDDPKAFVLYKD